MDGNGRFPIAIPFFGIQRPKLEQIGPFSVFHPASTWCHFQRVNAFFKSYPHRLTSSIYVNIFTLSTQQFLKFSQPTSNFETYKSTINLKSTGGFKQPFFHHFPSFSTIFPPFLMLGSPCENRWVLPTTNGLMSSSSREWLLDGFLAEDATEPTENKQIFITHELPSGNLT